PVNVVEKAVSLAKSKGIKYVYPGNLRNESIVTNCSNCGEDLIERTNFQTKILNFNGICDRCGTSVDGVWK
ncbi:MAG: hypothetical protein LBQ22_12060, partial [Bacteroidales bacterium]|nr:hypothetical protein [Bacteroidales bacterium]